MIGGREILKVKAFLVNLCEIIDKFVRTDNQIFAEIADNYLLQRSWLVGLELEAREIDREREREIPKV